MLVIATLFLHHHRPLAMVIGLRYAIYALSRLVKNLTNHRVLRYANFSLPKKLPLKHEENCTRREIALRYKHARLKYQQTPLTVKDVAWQ